jgi:hypothetical protein
MQGGAVSDWTNKTRWKILLATVWGAALQGCGPTDPLDLNVNADTYVGFSMWETSARERLEPAQMADFEEALQEIKYRTMADATAGSTETVDETTRDAINGRSVRYVLELGLGWELSRLQGERAELDKATNGNAHAYTYPGDTASANYLNDLVKRQEARLRAEDDKIDAVRRKLVALDPAWDQKELAQPPSPPATSQPVAPPPSDSLPQRIGRGKTRTPAST